MKKSALVLVLAAVWPLGAAAQLTQQQIVRIDSVFARFDRHDAPGCVLGVGMNGRVLYQKGYGVADLEHDARLSEKSIVEIGSVSKQFTTASVLLLAQDGKLSLDDDVRKWIPELPDFGKKITIRMLANHTSGLRDQWGLLGVQGLGPGSQEHSNQLILDLLSRQQDLNFPPNDQYLYSNSGFVLLAHIVQRASGKSLAEFSTERIFKPLGMNSTQWRDDHRRVVKGRALAYTAAGANGFRTEMPFTNVYGNGGLLTTVGDLLIWWDALMNNRLGTAGFTDAMATRAVLNNGKQIAYALGLSAGSYRGQREIDHGGATAGYRAHLAAYPESKAAIAVLCNRSDGAPEVALHRVADIVLADRLQPVAALPAVKAAPVSPSQIAARAGLYRNRSTEDVVLLEAQADKLLATRPNRYELIPVGQDVYRRTGIDFEARFTTSGDKLQLQLGNPDGVPNTFERVEPFNPSAQQLAEYVGTYTSPELGLPIDIVIEDGALVAKRRLQPALRLQPTFKDGFSSSGYFVFSRDANGRINGFKLTQGRIRHVRFDKR